MPPATCPFCGRSATLIIRDAAVGPGRLARHFDRITSQRRDLCPASGLTPYQALQLAAERDAGGPSLTH